MPYPYKFHFLKIWMELVTEECTNESNSFFKVYLFRDTWSLFSTQTFLLINFSLSALSF